MLRSTLFLFYFGKPVSTLHARFDTSESKRKINTCHLSQHILPKAHFKNTILFTDGAPAYPAVAEKLNVQHGFVNHSKGQFTKTVCRVQQGSPKVLAHTGKIDSCWKACKNMLPGSLSSQSPMIMTYVKAWHWRYIEMLMCVTSLQRRSAGWSEGKESLALRRLAVFATCLYHGDVFWHLISIRIYEKSLFYCSGS